MAIEFYAFRAPGNYFRPEFGIDSEEWAKVPFDTRLKISVTYPRNRKRDGMYWATLRDVVEATGDRWPTSGHLHKDVLMCLGYTTTYVSLSGEVRIEANSTAHDRMKDDEFAAYVTKAMAFLTEKLGFDVLARYEEIKRRMQARRAA